MFRKGIGLYRVVFGNPHMDIMLISGGNGFLGSHLAERTIKEGFEVTVLDDFSTSNRVNIPHEVTIIRGRGEDISLQNNFEHIVHLAATVGVDKIFWQSTKYFLVSTIGTSNPYDTLIHEKVSLSKIKKIVLAPSKSIYCESAYSCKDHSLVYPNPRPIEQLKMHDWEAKCPICGNDTVDVATTEEKPPQNVSSYALSMYVSEIISIDYSELLGIPTVAFRYFNVYGPRQSLNNPFTAVFAIFMSRLKKWSSPIGI